LQDRQYLTLGVVQEQPANMRMIAASNRSLDRQATEGGACFHLVLPIPFFRHFDWIGRDIFELELGRYLFFRLG
jgi:hypothetical protein